MPLLQPKIRLAFQWVLIGLLAALARLVFCLGLLPQDVGHSRSELPTGRLRGTGRGWRRGRVC